MSWISTKYWFEIFRRFHNSVRMKNKWHTKVIIIFLPKKKQLTVYEVSLKSLETFANGGWLQIHTVTPSIERKHIDNLWV